MSDFNIKDINQLTATTSTDGNQKIATDVPTGVGDDHNLRHITKANLFKYVASSIPTRVNDAAQYRVLNVKDEDVWLECIPGAEALYLRGLILGISNDGSSIPARFEFAGGVAQVVGEKLVLLGSTNSAEITFDEGADQALTVVENGVIQINPKITKVEPLTGATINVDNTQHAAYFIDPAGTIAALTINMPNAATEGVKVSFYFTENVTAVTHNGTSSATISSPLTTASAGDRITYIFHEADNNWFPIS